MPRLKSQGDWAKSAIRMPRDLHHQVHATAEAEDRTFNGQLLALIREALSKRHTQGAAQ